MEISVRLEGGLGDHILGTRFIPAIKELYSNANITAFSDTEGKTFQSEALKLCYPSFFKEIIIIPRKKYKEYWINCQFGLDNYKGDFLNIPDEYRNKIESYDKHYDLHIDSLKWINYDFDWLRYFKFFPKPEIKRNVRKRIVTHLFSATSVGHVLEQWYLESLINNLCNTFNDYEIIALSIPEKDYIYNNIKKSNFFIDNGDIKSKINSIKDSCYMISTDSGFKYLSYGFSIPTLTFSAKCYAPFKPYPSDYIRWLPFPETCLPIHHNLNEVMDISKKVIENNAYILYPEIIKNFDQNCVKRIYTLNEERSIINNE